MRIGSLFSGIGGLELGLEASGLGHTVWQVEQNEYCRSVLARHWPGAERFEDVREVGKHSLSRVDLVCGGFPCQDISSAGKGQGLAGERSGLWYEYSRIVGELEPEWIVVENVASGANRWVDQIRGELGQLGYETLPVPLSARDVGAPHLRRRVFIIAHANREQLWQQPGRRGGAGRESAPQPTEYGETRAFGNAYRNREPTQSLDGQAPGVQGLAGLGETRAFANGDREAHPLGSGSAWNEGPAIPPVCGVDDGVPNRVQRLQALGNAVVPQCAELIGWMIREIKERE